MGKVSWPERSSDAAFGCSARRGCRGLAPSRGEGSAGSSGPGGLPSGSGGSTTGAGSVLLRSRRGEGCRLCRLGGGGLWFWNLTVFTCCNENGARHQGEAGGLPGTLRGAHGAVGKSAVPRHAVPSLLPPELPGLPPSGPVQ